MAFADSHTHLTFDAFKEGPDAAIARAKEADVQYMTTIGTTLAETSPRAQLAAKHDGRWITVGVHPHNADEGDVSVEAILEAVRLGGEKVVAIGETGLDFHYDYGSQVGQEESFRQHIRAARLIGLPLILHIRKADQRAMEIMEEEEAHLCGGVLHCFTGSRELAEWGIENGFYISFSGIITFKNAQELREIALDLPLDRLLIETLNKNVTYVVKGGPAVNDATREDAEQAGLAACCRIIDNGAAAMGSLLELCSEGFRQRFERAPLIIAKGMANYESLVGSRAGLFFLLQTKCGVVAEHLGVAEKSIIILEDAPA